MQHYITLKHKPGWMKRRSRFEEPLKDWEKKARALRIRRERFLRQRQKTPRHNH